jgi:hypothetical protein
MAIQRNPSPIYRNEARNHVKNRCFAGSIRPQKTDRLAIANNQARIIDNDLLAVSLA